MHLKYPPLMGRVMPVHPPVSYMGKVVHTEEAVVILRVQNNEGLTVLDLYVADRLHLEGGFVCLHHSGEHQQRQNCGYQLLESVKLDGCQRLHVPFRRGIHQ